MNGGNEQAGTIYYDAIIDTKRLQSSAAQAERIVKGSVGSAEKATTAAGKNMSASLNGVAGSLAVVGSGYVALRTASSFIKQSISDANQYQMAMAGLASISNAFGQDTGAALQAARDFAADGLIPLAQASQAFKTALASGFTLEQATALLAGLKDQAVNNRQSFYDLGGAVNATLEGIKNGNSVLADATGTTKNLSIIAKEAGIGIDEMGSVSQNASYRMAILNEFMKQSAISAGDAARYADTAAGADARFATSMRDLRIEVGQVVNVLRQGLVAGLGEFIVNNQQAIITIGTGIAATAAFAGAAYGLVKAFMALRLAMTLIATHPVVAVLALTAGILASMTISNLMEELDKTQATSDNTADNLNRMPAALNGASKEAKKLAKELAKIDEQVEDTNRDFREQLAELVKNKEESISQLRDQLAQERGQYDKSLRDRLYDFERSQQEEASTHQKKVARLTSQIDFLRKYQNGSNKQQLADLQFALTRENSLYNKQVTERQTKYDEDAENERLSYEKRQTELQVRLDAETALLEKHRLDVAGIRNVILLDEIDKLKRSRDEQLKSLGQQRQDALDNATNTMNDSIATFNANKAAFAGIGNDLGNALGDNLKNALKNAVAQAARDIGNFLLDMGKRLLAFLSFLGAVLGGQGLVTLVRNKGDIGKSFDELWRNTAGAIGGDKLIYGRASGGNVSANNPYFVGENPDGSLNRTSELFVPNRSGTIVPSRDLQSMLGGGGTTNVTINVSGTFATSPVERRKVAEQIVEAFNQMQRARGVAQIGTA